MSDPSSPQRRILGGEDQYMIADDMQREFEKLGGEKSFPVAGALPERRIPFVFATGCDERLILESYQSVPRFEKPVDLKEVVQAILA